MDRPGLLAGNAGGVPGTKMALQAVDDWQKIVATTQNRMMGTTTLCVT